MNDQYKELMSAFMDGNIDDAPKVLDQLKSSSEMRGTWARYHIIRDVMKQRYQATTLDLQQRIVTAIENEPVLFMPRRQTVQKQIRRAAGWAVAASVMLVLAVWMGTSVFDTEHSELFATGNQDMLLNVEAEQALNDYIVNHNEYSAGNKLQGMLPYTRLVSATSPQQATDRTE